MTDNLRYFRDLYGVTWQVHALGPVKRWSADAARWVDSQYRLTTLVEDPDIREVTADEGLSVLPEVPSPGVGAEIVRTWRSGMTAGAVARAMQASRMDRATAEQWVTELVAGHPVRDSREWFDSLMAATRDITRRVRS